MANLDQTRELIGKQFRFESKNYPNHFIRHQNWKIFKHANDPSEVYQLDSSFDVIPGICGQGVTLRSVNYPAYYIRHYKQKGECFMHSSDGKPSFKEDASFIPRPGLADPKGVSFESVNFPGQYLRHYSDGVRKDINNTTPLFLEDATWYPRLIKTFEPPKDDSKENIGDAPQEIEPLRIAQQPTDKTKHCKQGTILTVRASGGSGALAYQWVKDGEPFSEDSYPDCIGVYSDTLQFLSLATVHSGKYMCRVSDEKANCVIESKPAVLSVISKMKLCDFHQESVEDVLVIIREGLIQKFNAFLQESGHTCADDLNVVMEEIEALAEVTSDDAMIDLTTLSVETKLSSVGTLKVFTNSDSEDREEQFTETVTYTVGSETSKTREKGWSVSGGLVGGYEGVQGGAGATYEIRTTKTQLAVQVVERTENFDKIIYVPRESSVKVSIEKRIETFLCNVSDLVVTFSGKKSSIKCKCGKKEKKQVKNRTFQLGDVFGSGPSGEDSHGHHNGKKLTVRMNGKCTWSETSVSVQCSDPEPLKTKK